MEKLTPRERFKLAVSHRQPDRPPILVHLTPEMHKTLADHFERRTGSRDVLAALEVDFRGLGVPWRGGKPAVPAGCDSVDIWGTGYRYAKNEFATYEEPVHLPLGKLETMDDVAKYPWPNPDDYDYSGLAEKCRAARPYVTMFGHAGMPDIVNSAGARGRGFERIMCDIMSGDEVGIAVADKRVDFYYRHCKAALEAARGELDMLSIGEDCGTQLGPLFPPETFREFFVPRLRKFIDLAHSHGAVCMMHSCGSVRDLYPTFIEMGLDIHDSAQPEPEGMEPEGLKRDFGAEITWSGLISTQQTLPKGTVEQCRAEAEHRIRVMGAGGGYIFAPAHCIQPDTPLENALAIYEVATGRKLS